LENKKSTVDVDNDLIQLSNLYSKLESHQRHIEMNHTILEKLKNQSLNMSEEINKKLKSELNTYVNGEESKLEDVYTVLGIKEEGERNIPMLHEPISFDNFDMNFHGIDELLDSESDFDLRLSKDSIDNKDENMETSESRKSEMDGFSFEHSIKGFTKDEDETKLKTKNKAPPTNDELLDISFGNMPELVETEKPREYKPKNPTTTPSYFPQEPLRSFEDPSFYPKFKPDTLFYVFYYQQGTYQQYLASKDLKNRSWRYHKTFLTWFQRHEVPEDLTPDYERGTYIYFDYETGWCQRMRSKIYFRI